MEELDEILKKSIKAIDDKYFLLPLDGDEPVSRERVYCYELYHQLRKRWPNDCLYTLNGEVDKSGHPKFRGTDHSDVKPDFLIHKPGSMGGNHAVFEVKATGTPLARLKGDVQTLIGFQKDLGYDRSIYLFFGKKAIGPIVKELRILAKKDIWRIEVLWQCCAREEVQSIHIPA